MKGRRTRAWCLPVLIAVGSLVSQGVTAQTRIATLEERFAGAERVVVAEARAVTSAWRENEHGDRLIMSQILLDVQEVLKGTPTRQVWMEMPGGTVDGITLEVSSLPTLRVGDRAVFFLNPTERENHRPYLKGQGILELDENERVRGSSLHLSQIRAASRIRY